MLIRLCSRNRMFRSLRSGLIAMVALFSGLFVLTGPSTTWFAAATVGGVLLTLGLAVGDMRRVLLTSLALLTPFYIHKGLFVRKGHVGGILSWNVAVIDVILLLLAFLWLAEMAVDKGRKVYVYASITVPAAIWFFVSALSIPGAIDPILGLFQLVMMVKLLILFLVVANQVRSISDTKCILVALLSGLFLQGILGLYQEWTGQPLGLWFLGETSRIRGLRLDLGLVARPQGTLGHPNDYAVYLEMLLPLALVLLFAKIKPLYKLLIGLTFCVGAVVLVLSLSRAGWWGFGLGMVVMLLLFLTRRSVIQPQRGSSPLVWVVPILLVIAFAFSGLVSSRLRSSDRGALASRFFLMRGAIAMIWDHPLLGVGLNNYALVMPRYNIGGGYVTDVHNIFLLIAAEVGLVGLAAFVWSLVAFFKRGLEFVRRAPVGFPWLIGLAIVAGSLSVLLHNQADYALMVNPPLATLFWFMAGWLMAISRGANGETQRGEIERWV